MAAELRRAFPADVERLLPLVRAHAIFEGSDATCTATDLQTALSGPTPRLIAWIADSDGDPIGYAACTVDFSTWSGQAYLHLDCLFVGAKHRSTGIGSVSLMWFADMRNVMTYTKCNGRRPYGTRPPAASTFDKVLRPSANQGSDWPFHSSVISPYDRPKFRER